MWRVRARCVCVACLPATRGGGRDGGRGGTDGRGFVVLTCSAVQRRKAGDAAGEKFLRGAYTGGLRLAHGEVLRRSPCKVRGALVLALVGNRARQGCCWGLCALRSSAVCVVAPVVVLPVVVFALSAKTSRQRQTIARNISEATLRTTYCESGTEFANLTQKP